MLTHSLVFSFDSNVVEVRGRLHSSRARSHVITSHTSNKVSLASNDILLIFFMRFATAVLLKIAM